MDITKLPVVEGVVGFLIVVIIITFIGAFSATGGGAEETVSPPPPPDETAGPDETPPPDGDSAIDIIMEDNSFDPADLTVKAGAPVTFNLINEGGATHNMHIAGPEGDYTEDFCRGGGDPCSDPNSVGTGDPATLTWEVPPAPGEVDFRCDFHPEDMTGTITVE